MVFLFPGILFRRAFFSGKFKKNFYSGNAFERILWSVLISFISIISFSFLINTINNNELIHFKINTGFSSEDAISIFSSLYENRLPENFEKEGYLYNCFKILFSIYLYSILVGYFFHKIIFYLGLEKRFSMFRFQNNWDYLTISNKQNNISHSIGDIFSTKVDVKTKDNQLFTGKLHEILFDKDGKMEAIAIQETYKFYRLDKTKDENKIISIKNNENNTYGIIIHSETTNSFVYRKRIKGEIFTILNNEIENISITYIKISNVFDKFQRYIKIITSILLLTVTLFSIAYGFWDFNIFPFQNTYKRIGFAIITPFNFVFLLVFLSSLFNLKGYRKTPRNYLNSLKDSVLILVIFCVPYTYIFGNARFLYMVIIFIFISIICASFLSNTKKNEDAS